MKFSQSMDIRQLYPCISCKLRLNAEIAGPGIVKKHEMGLELSENTQTTLSINGIQHNLIESFIYVPGAHRLPGQQDPYPLEVVCYFRTDDAQKYVCLCIPVQIGASNPYFAVLNQIVRNRPTLGTLISPTSSIISYTGADLRGRSGRNSRPRTLCDPVKRQITYYLVVTPASISAAEYQSLKAIAKDVSGPPKPMTEVIESKYKLLTRIDGMNIITKSSSSLKSTDKNGISTKALQCYRLDKEKDVIDDKVYIGGRRPGSTLEKELQSKQASDSDAEDSTDTSIQPGDIEKWIGIIIGISVGIMIIAFVAYIIWSGTFRDYLPNTPVSTTTKLQTS
jgi:carbonic anhydrase